MTSRSAQNHDGSEPDIVKQTGLLLNLELKGGSDSGSPKQPGFGAGEQYESASEDFEMLEQKAHEQKLSGPSYYESLFEKMKKMIEQKEKELKPTGASHCQAKEPENKPIKPANGKERPTIISQHIYNISEYLETLAREARAEDELNHSGPSHCSDQAKEPENKPANGLKRKVFSKVVGNGRIMLYTSMIPNSRPKGKGSYLFY